jgi:hypothetical protein
LAAFTFQNEGKQSKEKFSLLLVYYKLYIYRQVERNG